MKIFIIGFALLFALPACKTIVHTHQQVMLSYRTRGDVVKQFGSPDEMAENMGMKIWMYNCDRKPDKALQGRSTTVAMDSSKIHAPLVAKFTRHKRYMQFFFDQQGNVVSYSSRGVDLTQTKKNKTGTILLVTGLTLATAAAVFVVVVGLTMQGPFDNWGE